MTFLKTTLIAASLLTASTTVAAADGHSNGVTVISDLIGSREVGPDLVTVALVGGLLALLSATSATSTTN